jgi:hypothetical protein
VLKALVAHALKALVAHALKALVAHALKALVAHALKALMAHALLVPVFSSLTFQQSFAIAKPLEIQQETHPTPQPSFRQSYRSH